MQVQSVYFVGNLASDPELRFTASGHAVANFRLAVNQRRYDTQAGAWVDGDVYFARVNVWRDLAEHVAASLSRGDRAVVLGTMRERSWETDAGEKRYSTEVDAFEVGSALTFADAKPVRAARATPTPTGATDPAF